MNYISCIILLFILITSCENKPASESTATDTALDMDADTARESLSAEEQDTTTLAEDTPEPEVERNLVHAESERYIIKVERMQDGSIRYLSWDKPKSEDDLPDLVIESGEIVKEGTAGGYTYTFENAGYTYKVFDKRISDTMDGVGIFLSIIKDGQNLSYIKMNDLNASRG